MTAPLQLQLSAVSLFALLTSCRGDPVAGPFRIVIDEVKVCPADMQDAPFVLNVAHIQDKQNPDLFILAGNVTFPEELSDASDLRVAMAAKRRGVWQENAHVFSAKKVCSWAKMAFPPLYRDLMKIGHNGQDGKDCPVPAGTYSATNLTVDVKSPYIKTFFYGHWRIDVFTIEPRTKRRLMCIRVYLKIAPRRPATG